MDRWKLAVLLLVFSPVWLWNAAHGAPKGEGKPGGKFESLTEVPDRFLLKLEGQPKPYCVSKDKKNLVLDLGQLQAGDRMELQCSKKGAESWVEKVFVSGQVKGRVMNTGDGWIELALENGSVVRFRAVWRGGSKGGPDKKVTKLIAKQKQGDRVVLTWVLEEGKRVSDIKIQK